MADAIWRAQLRDGTKDVVCRVGNFVAGLALVLAAAVQAAPAAARDTQARQVAVGECAGVPCLLRDGAGPYRPRGLIVEGLSVAPESWPRLSPVYLAMARGFSVKTIKAVRQFGADSIRFNVGQQNLDPQSASYDPKYIREIEYYVKAARALGLTVLLEVNDEQPAGLTLAQRAVPNQSTVRAWRNLAPRFAGDQGVMYGAYNEPTIGGTDPASLARWQAGYGQVVDAIRQPQPGMLVKNVIVVDAPHWGGNLPATALDYLVADRLHNLVYGVHPFPSGRLAFPSGWPAAFGNFCALKPHGVLCQITAWNIYDLQIIVGGKAYTVAACPRNAPAAAQASMPAVSARLIAMGAALNSGIYGWAYDYPNVIVAAGRAVPVSLDKFISCTATPEPWGGGALLQQDFRR